MLNSNHHDYLDIVMVGQHVQQAHHLGGGSRGSHKPPPPFDHKAENLPQQHPSESTILHQFAANNKKIPGGGRVHASRPP